MRYRMILSFTAAAMAFGTAGSVLAANPVTLDQAMEAFLINHPEVLRRALANMQAWERQQQQSTLRDGITKNKAAIADSSAALVAGNPAGDVTMVEFLDYNCGYCRSSAEALSKAVEADGKVRILYKMLPVLGENSIQAARFVLAAKMVDSAKAVHLHDILLAHKGQLSREVLANAGRQAGLDTDKVVAAMDDPAIATALENAIRTAKDVGITGTPTFVVGTEVFIGAATTEAFLERFRQARQ